MMTTLNEPESKYTFEHRSATGALQAVAQTCTPQTFALSKSPCEHLDRPRTLETLETPVPLLRRAVAARRKIVDTG